MESHGLPEERFANTDKETTDEQASSVERRCLAGCGDGPDHGAEGDGAVGRDGFGEERSGNLASE